MRKKKSFIVAKSHKQFGAVVQLRDGKSVLQRGAVADEFAAARNHKLIV